jgi:hypothetical protein
MANINLAIEFRIDPNKLSYNFLSDIKIDDDFNI